MFTNRNKISNWLILIIFFSTFCVPNFVFSQTSNTLTLEKVIETRPFHLQIPTNLNLGDVESMAYVPEDGTIWVGDDGANCVHEIEIATGTRLSVISKKDLLENFSGVKDNKAEHGGSHLRELETSAYDRDNSILYIINTVNRPNKIPQPDIPAIYKFTRNNNGSFNYDSWHELSRDYGYGGMVVIDGVIHISNKRKVYSYDFATKTFSDNPLFELDTSSNRPISGMSYDGEYLWLTVYHTSNKLWKVKWEDKSVVTSYDMSETIADLRGVSVFGNQVILGEGYSPSSTPSKNNEIYVYNISDSFSKISSKIINVPNQYPTLIEAYEASIAGDTILVENGTYELPKLFKIDKPITIASKYIFTKNEADINNTIIKPTNDEMHEWFEVAATDSRVIGFKFIGNTHHTLNITAEYAYVTHCKFFGGNDQVSFSGGGGYVGYCYFENAGDDALDCDQSITWTIEHNTIVNAHQDGIEIRLHYKDAPLTTHHFNNNTVIAAGESGIQLIDYKGNSFREFYIHNNIFQNCEGAGVSCMYKEKDNTKEVYRGSLMEETAFVYNNTFVGCNYGLTISPGLLILNNIFVNIKTKAIERGIYVNDSNDKSIVDYSIFYNNKTNYDEGVILGENNLIDVNPMLNSQFGLKHESPCIDKGILNYKWKGKSINLAETKFVGEAIDLGALEFGESKSNIKNLPVINIGNDVVLLAPKNKTLLKGSVSGVETSKPLAYSWDKVTGPGEVKFSNQDKLETSASFSEEGIYKIMLIGSDAEHSVSDEVTIYFVNDFVDRTISVGAKKNALVEAEDYRYLVGSAKVISFHDGSGVISKDDKTYTQYEVSTTASGTFYLWVRIKGGNGKLVVSFNDLENEKEIEITNATDSFAWKKVEFSKIPEGIYPLRIRATEADIIWDKIFITSDITKSPNK